jgi:diadenosine tetraphosphate (Ap4A) HIT family hydrolase
MSFPRRPPKTDGPRFDYRNDCKLYTSKHFLVIANGNQGRSHFMIRAQRDAPANFPNSLNHLPDDIKIEFWHLVQRLIAEARFPAVICHHFGRWRSADHFHLHIVTGRTDFANFTAGKMTPPGNVPSILEQIARKETALIEGHLNQFKGPEIDAIQQSPPPRKAKHFAPSE